MQAQIRLLWKKIEQLDKEIRQQVDALSIDTTRLAARVASLENVGDDVPEERVRQARIPARPDIMVASGAGADAKGG